MLRVDDNGEAKVEASTEPATVTLGVAALGSILLGGVRANTMYAAGRIHGEASAIAVLDRQFGALETPWLGFTY